MTVSATTSVETFACDGVTVVFTCPFRVLDAQDVRAYLIEIATGNASELTNGVDFTVSGVGEANAIVTMVGAYGAAYQVKCQRKTSRVQETDYRDNDPFPAESHERALDRLTMLAQEDEEALQRSILAPESETMAALPAAADRADKLLSFDSNGNPVAAAPVNGSAAALAVDLASSSSGAKGAGMSGYSGTATYAAGTVGAKLHQFLSPKDFGAAADGTTSDTTAIASAVQALPSGGALNAAGGVSVGENGRKLYPGLVGVNHHDHATVGTNEQLSNPTFADSADGWTLSGFTASGTPDKIAHTAGASGTATLSDLTIKPYALYRVRIKISTTTSGIVRLQLAGQDLFEGIYLDAGGSPMNGYWFDSSPVQTYGSGANGTGSSSGWPNTSADTWDFLYMRAGSSGTPVTGDLQVSTDTRWAGSIEQISVVEVEEEAQFAFSSLTQSEAAAGTTRNPAGFKNYNSDSGTLAFGDRRTAALVPETPSSAPYAGALNTIFGHCAATAQQTGVENAVFGAFAAMTLDGSANSAFGYSAMKYATKAMECTAFGYKVLLSNVIGIANTAGGYEALIQNIAGSYVTAWGWLAGRLGLRPDRCTYVGAAAGVSNANGTDCTFVGHRSGPWTADLGTATTSYDYQTAVGASAKTFGDGAIALGYGAAAGANGAAAEDATAVGTGAFASATKGIAIGDAAAASATQATAVGSAASGQGAAAAALGADARAVGDESVAVGSSSRGQGTYDVSVGRGAGGNLTGGGNTSIGNLAGAVGSAQTYENTTNLGNGAAPTGSNQVTLGNASVATLRCQVTTITALSDERDKANVRPMVIPDAFLDDLQPVMWEWAVRGGSARDGSTDFGAIAQHLKALQETHGVQWLGLVDESNPDRLEATPGKLLWPLILKVQAQSRALAILAARVEALEGK